MSGAQCARRLVRLGFSFGSGLRIFACCLVCISTAGQADDRVDVDAKKARLVDVRKIWDRAPHNAFTDLIRHKGRWLCVFREGKGHVSPDGALRILESKDGLEWKSAALITAEDSDLRDAKITLLPDGRCMLSGAGAMHSKIPRHQSYAWFSGDGRSWTRATPIGDPNFWLWRTSWSPGGKALSIGYATTGDKRVRLYESADGKSFRTLVADLGVEGYPNESQIVFTKEGEALCLLRRDPQISLFGSSRPPYTKWSWKETGARAGGPALILLPDGRLLAAVRLYDDKVRTSLCWMDRESGKLREFLALPSGGDTSYAGLVWHEKTLWVSYYSSHEGKTSIYLARVEIPALPGRRSAGE